VKRAGRGENIRKVNIYYLGKQTTSRNEIKVNVMMLIQNWDKYSKQN